jgi:hypothetical protein
LSACVRKVLNVMSSGDLGRLTVFTRVETVTNWVMALAVVVAVARVASFVTVDVKGWVVVVGLLVEEVVNLVTCFPSDSSSERYCNTHLNDDYDESF